MSYSLDPDQALHFVGPNVDLYFAQVIMTHDMTLASKDLV